MIKPDVTVTQDRVADLLKSVRQLTKDQILVGVPDSKAARTADDGSSAPQEINNAALAYIHNYGSPARNIPARPFMEPGLKNGRPLIVRFLKAAAVAACDGKPDDMRKNFDKAGLTAQAAIQKKVMDGPFDALSPVTLAARQRRGRTGTKPLIDTGQMLRSITYVIRRKKGRS